MILKPAGIQRIIPMNLYFIQNSIWCQYEYKNLYTVNTIYSWSLFRKEFDMWWNSLMRLFRFGTYLVVIWFMIDEIKIHHLTRWIFIILFNGFTLIMIQTLVFCPSINFTMLMVFMFWFKEFRVVENSITSLMIIYFI